MGEDVKFYAFFTLLSVFSFLFLRTLSKQCIAARRLPPSPSSLPLIGHLHLLAPIPHQALHKLSLRYGPLMSLRLGSVPCIVASSAATARYFLKTHELSFSDRPITKAIAYLTYSASDFSFAPYGPYWSFMKKLCMSDLLGGRTLNNLLPIRQEEKLSLLRNFHDKAKTSATIDVGSELLKFTNNVISRMTMGKRCMESDGVDNVSMLVKEVAEITGKFNLADYVSFCKNMDLQGFDKKLEDLRRRFDSVVEGVMIEKERDSTDDNCKEKMKDLLDLLIEISRDENAEMKLTRENIKAFILDIFVAGTDTSATTVEWALAELINHPKILHKLREEITSVVGARLVEESDIPELPYLQAVLKETLRLHPTGPIIIRQSGKDCTIDSYDIAANTTLFVNVWAMGRDPEQWPEPLEFRPERFTEKAFDVRGQHYEYLPFGTGRRMCPGMTLAMQVIQAALAGMVQCFEWEVSGDKVVDMAEGLGLTLPRANPLVCTPVARLNPMPLY